MTSKVKEPYNSGDRLQEGMSVYTPDVGTVQEPIYCGVCCQRTEVRRNVVGPRGIAQAMGGGQSTYDMFICPHRDEPWHRQATTLIDKARSSVSAKLEAILREEAAEVLRERCPSKKLDFVSLSL